MTTIPASEHPEFTVFTERIVQEYKRVLIVDEQGTVRFASEIQRVYEDFPMEERMSVEDMVTLAINQLRYDFPEVWRR
jgi:hypothetical protein